MRTDNRIRDIEDRVARIEAMISVRQSPNQVMLADEQIESFLERIAAAVAAGRANEMSELSDLRTQLNRQLVFQNDRIASLALKLDMTHSRVERIDRIQDEVRQNQEEHESTLGKILDQLECQSPSLQSAPLRQPRGRSRPPPAALLATLGGSDDCHAERTSRATGADRGTAQHAREEPGRLGWTRLERGLLSQPCLPQKEARPTRQGPGTAHRDTQPAHPDAQPAHRDTAGDQGHAARGP